MPVKISSYYPYTNKDGKITAGLIPYDSTLEQEINHIKNGTHKELIEKLYSIEDKQERRLFKASHLPCFTVSVVCKDWRNSDNIVNHTGLICIDIDKEKNKHIKDWGELRDAFFSNSKSVVAAFISASKEGLAIVVKIMEYYHSDVFNSIMVELEKNGLIIDIQCKDKVRLRFTSYDPDAKIRPYEDAEYMIPSEEYLNNVKKQSSIKYFPTSNINGISSFKNAMNYANSWGEYTEGQKHYHLIRVASYCNRIGMELDLCKNFTRKYYGDKIPLKDSALIEPIEYIYKCYKSQYATKIPPKPEYTIKQLKWLLNYINKQLLKSKIIQYGNDTFVGTEKQIYNVNSKLLAFFMHILAPEYTWTTKNIGEHYSVEEIKDLIPENAYLDSVNDSRVWCCKTYKIPLDLC